MQVIPLAVGDLTRGAIGWSPQNPFQLTGARTIQASAERSYGGSPVGEAGIGRKWSRVANAGIDFGTSQVITQNSGVTVLVVAAPTAAATMKVPFSQRLASGSYTQTDLVFNAATVDSLGATAGQLALTTYHNASGGVLAAGQIDGKMHCWVAGNGPATGYIFRDGAKQTLSASTRTSTFAAANQKLRVGNMADDASTSYVCDDPVYQMIFFDRLLPEAQARMISENPQRAIAPRRRFTFFDLGGASSVAASAAGVSQADASATPSTQVAISGIGVSTGAGVAQASIVFPLSAAGLVVSGGAGDASAAVSLDAFALARAAAQAGVSPAVLLAGAAAAESAGNAALAVLLNELAAGAAQAGGSSNLTGSAPGEMSASGKVVAAGQTALSITVRLQAAGNTHAGGGADGRVGSAGDLSALGQAIAGGWSQQSALVNVTAAGFVKAMLQGRLDIDVPLVSQGINIASARAGLSVGGAVRSVRLEAGRPVVLTTIECTAVPALIIHHEAQHV